MLEEKNKSFEEIFNEWYKKFVEEETVMNNEIKQAKLFREEKINQARREALETIKSYELEQRDKLEADKEKLNVTKNFFEKMDADYQVEVAKLQAEYKQNKGKVVEFLIESIFSVEVEIPQNIKKSANDGK